MWILFGLRVQTASHSDDIMISLNRRVISSGAAARCVGERATRGGTHGVKAPFRTLVDDEDWAHKNVEGLVLDGRVR
ncbi:hypothetical protein Lesp02_30570 [Lentzea sp. NBRC 105346]|nr:hypothetical protein Lesp02_30570 [Lentzea sp. NBRC 105346]